MGDEDAGDAPVLRVTHAFTQKVLKGEDAAFSADTHFGPQRDVRVSIHAVFDGHNGPLTSHFCRRHFLPYLEKRWPARPLPPETDKQAYQEYMAEIRAAVAETFVLLDSESIAAKCRSGSTASVLIICGSLATVANVGDSEMLMVTAGQHLVVSQSHRIGDTEDEIQRIRDSGHTVAQLSCLLKGPARPGEEGIGPIRIWPGGLTVSRSIGDIDVGRVVLAAPHIRQIRLPPEGARFLLASDGVWDGCSTQRAAALSRSKPLKEAGPAIVRQAMMKTGLTDDTTITVVDVLPPGTEDFSHQQPKSSMMGCLIMRPSISTMADDNGGPICVLMDSDMARERAQAAASTSQIQSTARSIAQLQINPMSDSVGSISDVMLTPVIPMLPSDCPIEQCAPTKGAADDGKKVATKHLDSSQRKDSDVLVAGSSLSGAVA